jgi:hypothetical protein
MPALDACRAGARPNAIVASKQAIA